MPQRSVRTVAIGVAATSCNPSQCAEHRQHGCRPRREPAWPRHRRKPSRRSRPHKRRSNSPVGDASENRVQAQMRFELRGVVGVVRLVATPGPVLDNLRGYRQTVTPARLPGERFPIELFTPVRGSLRALEHGTWLVVVGSTRCPVCKGWVETLRRQAHSGQGQNVAWCLLGGTLRASEASKLNTAFSPRENVVITGHVPVVLRIRDGVVQEVFHRVDAAVRRRVDSRGALAHVLGRR